MNVFMAESTEESAEAGGVVKGMAIGIVSQNKDATGMGRVKVRFPWRENPDESHWARISVPMAGPDRGTYFLPEVNDEPDAEIPDHHDRGRRLDEHQGERQPCDPGCARADQLKEARMGLPAARTTDTTSHGTPLSPGPGVRTCSSGACRPGGRRWTFTRAHW